MMFSPINIRFFRQGDGAPIIDGCTTVRKFTHDDGGGETRVLYSGIAICPLGSIGSYRSIAITFRKRVHVHRHDNPAEKPVAEVEAKG